MFVAEVVLSFFFFFFVFVCFISVFICNIIALSSGKTTIKVVIISNLGQRQKSA